MSAQQPKRILVAGGAGFLGSHLCEHLLRRGDRVICLDDLSSGSLDNLTPLLDDARFRLVRHDVSEPIDLEVDQIYNLACPASPALYQLDPIRTTMTSVLGARNLLELATRRRARILQASTSEVYGDPMLHPQPETYRGNVSPIGVRSCYDEGKRCAETLFFDYHRRRGVPIKVARIFNTYGPRMLRDDGRIVSNLVVQGLQGQPLTIYGDGTQTRAFCYVSDLIDGLVKLMESDQEVTGPINLGSPRAITVSALARLVCAMTGNVSTIVHLPLPEDDPRQREPCIALAKRLLGWSPRVSLEQGLRLTIEDFRARFFEAPAAKQGTKPRPASAPSLVAWHRAGSFLEPEPAPRSAALRD